VGAKFALISVIYIFYDWTNPFIEQITPRDVCHHQKGGECEYMP